MSRLAIVTASTRPLATQWLWQTWFENKELDETGVLMVLNGPRNSGEERLWREPEGKRPTIITTHQYGVVPNFLAGVLAADRAWHPDYILCLHDDVSLDVQGWDRGILSWLEEHPHSFFGFGGGISLGRVGMYDEPYDPMSLARGGFVSNMKHAEAHGRRATQPVRVACLDGFSIGGRAVDMVLAFEFLHHKLNIVHHAYDAAIGALAARWKREVWMLPVPCHHTGGLTAVADRQYNEWAQKQIEGGDMGFWEASHRAVWEEFKDVLPIATDW